MTEPLLVVHGVANRDPEAFEQTLHRLQDRLGSNFELISVYWGDLGGISTGLRNSLPVIFPRSETTRGDATGSLDEEEGRRFFELLQSQRTALMRGHLTRGGDDTGVVEALYQATLQAGGASARAARGGGVGRHITRGGDDLREALAEAVPASTHLKHVQDPELQRAVGELISEFLQSQPGGQMDSWTLGDDGGRIVTRGWMDDARNAVKRFVGKVDELIGTMAGAMGGSLNQWLRGALAEPIALTLGDIVAYHQRRKEIHERLFARLDEKAPGWGTQAQPIGVVAHSLGGLVTLDAALGSDVVLADKPRVLHIKRWVTFGSQAAFFHVLAPRKGIAIYEPGRPVSLPPSIGRWVNLWHPLDALAFSATPVFKMSDGSLPRDERVDTPASDIVEAKGWLHSIYWDSPRLIDAIK